MGWATVWRGFAGCRGDLRGGLTGCVVGEPERSCAGVSDRGDAIATADGHIFEPVFSDPEVFAGRDGAEDRAGAPVTVAIEDGNDSASSKTISSPTPPTTATT